MEISQQKICLVGAVVCHKKAGDDACAHLDCIEKTGKCLKKAGLRLHHLPPFVVSTELYQLLSDHPSTYDCKLSRKLILFLLTIIGPELLAFCPEWKQLY